MLIGACNSMLCPIHVIRFSLSVKFQDIRHIVIMCRGGKYGFSEPTEFDSVLALVEYFQATSLAHYNAELETTLAYPFREVR